MVGERGRGGRVSCSEVEVGVLGGRDAAVLWALSALAVELLTREDQFIGTLLDVWPQRGPRGRRIPWR